MRKVKKIAKKTLRFLGIYFFISKILFRLKTVEQRFDAIYKNNAWGGLKSVSGRGSDLDQTEFIISELPLLFERLSISSILDIPCGDFNWFNKIDLKKYQYIGGDIVKDIIKNNKKLYECGNVSFQRINLLRDSLPKADLVFVRDCFIHFSNKDIFKAVNNICLSNSKYLLTTTFPQRKENWDTITGGWHPLNLQIDPFFFPAPLFIINEKCTEENMSLADKSLALWEISTLRNCLNNLHHLSR